MTLSNAWRSKRDMLRTVSRSLRTTPAMFAVSTTNISIPAPPPKKIQAATAPRLPKLLLAVRFCEPARPGDLLSAPVDLNHAPARSGTRHGSRELAQSAPGIEDVLGAAERHFTKRVGIEDNGIDER